MDMEFEIEDLEKRIENFYRDYHQHTEQLEILVSVLKNEDILKELDFSQLDHLNSICYDIHVRINGIEYCNKQIEIFKRKRDLLKFYTDVGLYPQLVHKLDSKS